MAKYTLEQVNAMILENDEIFRKSIRRRALLVNLKNLLDVATPEKVTDLEGKIDAVKILDKDVTEAI